MRLAAVFVALVTTTSSFAQASELAAGVGFDTLNNNYDSWQHAYVRGSHDVRPDLELLGQARRYERFGLTNTEVSAGSVWQINGLTSLSAEAAFTPNADFRPDQRLNAALYRSAWQNGGITLGAQYSFWPQNDSSEVYIEPDYYYKQFRFAWRFSRVNLQNVGSSSSQRISVAWYYSDRSRVTLAVSDGREIEQIRDNLVVAKVRSLAIYGRHHLRRAWSFEYALSFTDQGDFYNRTGAEIGIHYRF
ncbi:YaiO family outer membrane beta-barrel protein [Aliidiomarina sp. Khilg15.8]